MAQTTTRRTRQSVWTSGALDAVTLIGPSARGFNMQARVAEMSLAIGRIDKRESFVATSMSLRFAGGP